MDDDAAILAVVVFQHCKRIRNMFLAAVTMLCNELNLHYMKHILKDNIRTGSDLRRIFAMEDLVYGSDKNCIIHLRMDRHTFSKLVELLSTIGRLEDTKNMRVDEMVVLFILVVSHHQKNRVVKERLRRSGETVSRVVNKVVSAMMLLTPTLMKKMEAVSLESNDYRWKCFKNCVGAIDGTYIDLFVPTEDKPRYRTRKGNLSTNVLACCSQDMQFTYVLPGWEGSAHDARILRSALARTRDGLKVPTGHYLLADAGYPNGTGFLAPYRGQRYHLNNWDDGQLPTTPEEYFNMKHSSARNVIERCFGLLKAKWGILRSPSWYPVKTFGRIIIACCLLHNLVRQEMSYDTGENLVIPPVIGDPNLYEPTGESIEFVETTSAWSHFRDELAREMFDQYVADNA